MDVNLLFKIAGIGILVTVIVQLLRQNGREELATVAAIAGLVLATMLVISMIASLLETVRQTFSLY
ncbi:MAG: stage III sporulation protein AC [Clostridia bacterium]|nr:stage III sporulation protein AC [Clostridia bacterium]MBR4905926.1 stage III sporulation protein AC [Clostridia bacterium]